MSELDGLTLEELKATMKVRFQVATDLAVWAILEMIEKGYLRTCLKELTGNLNYDEDHTEYLMQFVNEVKQIRNKK